MFSLTSLGLLGTTGIGTGVACQGLMNLSSNDYVAGGVLSLVGGAIAAASFRMWSGRFEVAEPSEWMLVIENGDLKQAAVGLQHFRGFMQTCVKFPARMRNVEFEAEQVTKEIQGVKLKGFCTWSIYREGDGPYRAYRSFDGMNKDGASQANSNIGQLVESILRNMVSSKSIDEIMTQRDELRNQAKEELLDITKGWGIWIETVEITDVRIMSSSLFNNMQEAFRSETRLKADEIRMKTDQTIKNRQRENELSRQKLDENARTEKYQVSQKQDLTRKKLEFETQKEQHKISLARLEQNSEYDIQSQATQNRVTLARIDGEQAVELKRVEHQLNKDEMQNEHKRAQKQAELSLQNDYSEMNLKLRKMDILEKAVSRINYDMKVVNVGNAGSDLAQMIPGLAALYNETTQ